MRAVKVIGMASKIGNFALAIGTRLSQLAALVNRTSSLAAFRAWTLGLLVKDLALMEDGNQRPFLAVDCLGRAWELGGLACLAVADFDELAAGLAFTVAGLVGCALGEPTNFGRRSRTRTNPLDMKTGNLLHVAFPSMADLPEAAASSGSTLAVG